MPRLLATLLAVPLITWAPGCIYDLDVEGKKCNTSDHICPSGYECVEWEGENVCKPKKDGGGNGGDGSCSGNETECIDDDIDKIRVCSADEWVVQDCPENQYCTDFEGYAKAACVLECSSHEDCPSYGGGSVEFYCDDTTHHCELKGSCHETPGVNRCNPDGTKVVNCNPVTGNDDVVQNCETGQYCDRDKAQCRDFCQDDSGCDGWPQESCDLGTSRCERIFLCTESPNDCNTVAETDWAWIATRCEADDCECTGSVCVIRPVEQCAANVLDLSCYLGPPTDPGTTPATCNLEGAVALFENLIPVDFNADLEVRVHSNADILSGDTSAPLKSTAVTDDMGKSHYNLQGLPTRQFLVLEVRCKDDDIACGYHNMYTFGLYLRPDECTTGTISFSAPAIPNSLWATYATGAQVTADPNKGVFLGRLKECSVATNKIEKGTGDVSMSRELVYYIPFEPPIKPEDTSTSTKGWFGAANVQPVRGKASALVRDQGALLSLRTYDIRIFENSASLVFFDKPKNPDAW